MRLYKNIGRKVDEGWIMRLLSVNSARALRLDDIPDEIYQHYKKNKELGMELMEFHIKRFPTLFGKALHAAKKGETVAVGELDMAKGLKGLQ